MFHFYLFKLVQRHKTDFDADCRLSFVCSRRPSCRLLHVDVVVYLTYLHCSCPIFQNCCTSRKVHGGQRRKTVIHCTAVLFNNALLQQTLAGRAKRRNLSSLQTCTSDVFFSNKPVKESGTSFSFYWDSYSSDCGHQSR